MLKTNVVMFVAKRQSYAQRCAHLQITSKHQVSYMVFYTNINSADYRTICSIDCF